jgi:hypothetical protein
MKKILSFIDVWGFRIIFPLSLMVFLKTCTTNSKVESVGKKVDNTNKEIDSLYVVINSLKKEIRTEIKIEGLKSEKRMIQSTDRKILDVNRQSEIDKEIENLQK